MLSELYFEAYSTKLDFKIIVDQNLEGAGACPPPPPRLDPPLDYNVIYRAKNYFFDSESSSYTSPEYKVYIAFVFDMQISNGNPRL